MRSVVTMMWWAHLVGIRRVQFQQFLGLLVALASHLTDVKVMYCDNKYYELCGQMGHLIGVSGIGKAQFTNLVEAIQRNSRDHDMQEFQKLVNWQRLMKTKGAITIRV